MNLRPLFFVSISFNHALLLFKYSAVLIADACLPALIGGLKNLFLPWLSLSLTYAPFHPSLGWSVPPPNEEPRPSKKKTKPFLLCIPSSEWHSSKLFCCRLPFLCFWRRREDPPPLRLLKPFCETPRARMW